MLFNKKLKAQESIVREAVDELFNVAFTNQTHPQDLLLVLEHGYYYNDSPILGEGELGFSEYTQYEFYDWYRKSFVSKTEEFNEKVKTDSDYKDFERLSIQIEKTVYLKFWESDMILKTLKQLVNLANGKAYDWNLKIPVSNREGGKGEVIRKEIKNVIKSICPKFYDLLTNTYLRQIRNAIAHSQFYIIDRMIIYLNYSDDPQAFCPIRSLTFDDWGIYFHNTILLYNELIRNEKKWKEHYIEQTKKNGSLEIRVSKIQNIIFQGKLRLRDNSKSWVWD